jgi:hypothetical protein
VIVLFYLWALREPHVTWKEEVKLSNGEMIVIERDVRHAGGGGAWPHGQGSVPMEHVIRIGYPANSKELLTWRSSKVGPRGTYAELPLVFDRLQDGTWSIVTAVYINGVCVRYTTYRQRAADWVELPPTTKLEPRSANLFLAGGSSSISGLIRLPEKEKENADSAYPLVIRQIGPESYGCIGGYVGPWPPVESPPDCDRYPAHPACKR